MTFCRLEKQKNLPMLLRAFADFRETHPDYRLEIYGNGSEREGLVGEVKSLGLEGCASIFPGRPDVHKAVRDAAMFVLPSDYEGLSNSMLEAMAMGMPVICTDCPCGGARMAIRGRGEWDLVPVGDGRALCNAMGCVADDRAFADGIASRATDVRNLFSARSICEKWIGVMEGRE